MTKPTLSVVSNEVEVVLNETHDPRLAGWRQSTRLWCRADHQIVVDEIVEGRSGGVIDETHYLRVGISTHLAGREPDPFPYPLYFRRADDTGRSSLAWFDQAAFEKAGAADLVGLLGHIEALQRASGLGAVDTLLLARLGLARMLAEIPDGPHGAPERDVKQVADWAYQLGYLAALDDAKARGVEHLAQRGVGNEKSLASATEAKRAKARADNLPLTTLARQIAALDRNMSLSACAREVARHIQLEPTLKAFSRRDLPDIRQAILAAEPPIFMKAQGQYRPIAGGDRR
ncbi:hypothetical protein BZG35_03455 [Brevundimonas sp. LM2]|uniref:hypothetical protein n=1 Tax=Brevundimonas sp. LM2 TaxID=1938605 RepID=UPI0009840255|nr:hypothetical protein [Brevundimonas sp. LM2]AQR60814.1 hypothetical protein BZG35_03455 [Brevundimonas sp. LM2]